MVVSLTFTELRKVVTITDVIYFSHLNRSGITILGFSNERSLKFGNFLLNMAGVMTQDFGKDSVETTKTYKIVFSGNVQVSISE